MFSITTFNELLKGLPRSTFDRLIKRHNADKYCKHFGHWNHLIVMLYAQLSGTTGLRPLQAGFNSQAAAHHHLGVKPIKRATLADANEKRSDVVFAEIASWLMGQADRSVRREGKELLYLLDSTSFTLKGQEFDRWTVENKTRNTQGIKLHMLLNATNEAPTWSRFSTANVNDVEMAPSVPLVKDALYVCDRGYCDYNWWHQIDSNGARFVTRFKSNAGIKVIEERPIGIDEADTIISDSIVQLKSKQTSGGRKNLYRHALRRVTVMRADKETPLVLATNDLESPASVIARRYKDRWAIELFFKWIKQHLRIKKFLGRSENAVRIQILTALIGYLLVVLYKQRHALQESLWECLCVISATLFQRVETEEARKRRRRRIDDARILATMQPCLF
jgi:putative transposase